MTLKIVVRMDRLKESDRKMIRLIFRHSTTPEYSLSAYDDVTLTALAHSHRVFLVYEEVHIIERLFSSSLIALVSQQAPRRLKVCHFKKGSEICTYSFASSIHAVKLNRTVSRHSIADEGKSNVVVHF